jgi:hypothetical protein
VNGSPVRITTAPVTEAYEQGTDPAGIHRTGEEHRVVLRARNLPDASVSVAERETTAADEIQASGGARSAPHRSLHPWRSSGEAAVLPWIGGCGKPSPAKLARADPIESRVEFEAGPAANNPGLRAVLRRHARGATRQRTLEANGIDCGAGPVSGASRYAASSMTRPRLSAQASAGHAARGMAAPVARARLATRTGLRASSGSGWHWTLSR